MVTGSGAGRDDSEWIADLRSDGEVQEQALADLRAALLRGLRRALHQERGIDAAFLEDTVQEALVRIVDRLDQYAGRSRFLTWAMAVAVRLALSELRRLYWHDVSLDQMAANRDAPRDELAVSDQAGPDQQIERRSILEDLRRAIQNDLTDRQRTALMADLEGQSTSQIAEALKVTRNALYKLLYDARRKLKQSLEAAGYTAADIESAF